MERVRCIECAKHGRNLDYQPETFGPCPACHGTGYLLKPEPERAVVEVPEHATR